MRVTLVGTDVTVTNAAGRPGWYITAVTVLCRQSYLPTAVPGHIPAAVPGPQAHLSVSVARTREIFKLPVSPARATGRPAKSQVRHNRDRDSPRGDLDCGP